MIESLLHEILLIDRGTLVFIAISIPGLTVIQLFLLRYTYNFIFIAILHAGFGLLLSLVTRYHPLVHVMIYILPSITFALVIHLWFYKRRIIEDPSLLSYQTNKGKLSINPFSGVCILGVPKAGKTASIIKPTIQQLAEKSFCGIIYDYKQFDLTKSAYHHYQDQHTVDFKMVNFFNLPYTNRINPLSPHVIQHPAFALEASTVFLANMAGATKSLNGSDRYWMDSAAGLFAAIIWRLQCDYPEYCDLPHAIAIGLNKSTDELTSFIEENDQSRFLAASYLKSLGSDKQLAGIVGTLAGSLSKVALPELFYVLSGDEVNLNLNDPDQPTLLCLSNTQQLDSTYAPALALIISVCIKLMNQPGRHPSAILLDEAPTLVIPNFDNIPATARSNKVATFFCAQDMVQSEAGYGRVGRDKILATLATHFYGRVTDPSTADRYSKMFGTIEKKYTSKSRRSGAMFHSGYTDSMRDVHKYKPEMFHQLEVGEFLGVIGDGNMKELRAKFSCYQDYPVQLPLLKNITTIEVHELFDSIVSDSLKLV